MGVETNFLPFITIRSRYNAAQKIPEPLIFKAPGSLGEKIRTSGLLNPIQELEPYKSTLSAVFDGSTMGVEKEFTRS